MLCYITCCFMLRYITCYVYVMLYKMSCYSILKNKSFLCYKICYVMLYHVCYVIFVI